MSIFEFDEAKFKKAEREAGREEGIEAGEADLLVRLADKAFLAQMCEKYQV